MNADSADVKVVLCLIFAVDALNELLNDLVCPDLVFAVPVLIYYLDELFIH